MFIVTEYAALKWTMQHFRHTCILLDIQNDFDNFIPFREYNTCTRQFLYFAGVDILLSNCPEIFRFHKILLLNVPRWYFFCGSFVLFMSCVCHAFMSVHCCLVVTCLERADLLALVCDVWLCFCYFPIWYPETGLVLDCIDSGSLHTFLTLILRN